MTAPSVLTAASTTSNGTAVDGADQDNLSFLARLQGQPIHAPPGPRPLRTGARVPTKTQIAADWKAERLVKKQAVEEKKLAVAACKVKRESKKKEKLISAAKDKAAKVLAKAEELHLKLAEAINGGGSGAAAGQELVHHPQKKSRGLTGQSVAGAVALSHSYLSPQRKGTTAKKRVSVRSPRHLSHRRANSLSSGSSSSGSLSTGVLTIGKDSDDDEEGAAADGGIPQGNRAEPCGGHQYCPPYPEPQRWRRINRSSSSEDSASSSSDEGDGTTSWGSRGGKGSRGNNKSMSRGDGDQSSGTDKAGSNLLEDEGKDEILEGIWTGTHDPHLLTRFVSSHFSRNRTAYLPFEHWADARSMTAPGVPIWLDNWLEEEEDEVNDNKGDAGGGGLGSRGNGLGVNTINMCNKTCLALPLAHLGSDASGATVYPCSTPSAKGGQRSLSAIRHSDIWHMFPPVARKLTPQEQARDLVMEEEITLQARDQQAVARQVQALWEKFAAAANEKCPPAQEPEVRWVRAQPGLPPKAPDAAMAGATQTLPGIQSELSDVKRGSRGSKFCQAAKRAEGMSAQLNGQFKEQERIADTANALVASLQDSARLLGQPTSATSLESIPVEQATQVHQGSLNLLASDLAILHQVLQSCSPTSQLEQP